MTETLDKTDGAPACFVECLIPVTACNLRCSYCYVIQENRRAGKNEKLPYDLDTIRRATTQDRWGGPCFFSLCGAGETFIPDYTVDLGKTLLENGHFINFTTNGTLTKRFERIVSEYSEEELSRVSFAFSYHYLELKRIHALERFFHNVRLVHDAGASILVQLNLVDEYLPYLDELRELCIREVGAAPQLAATRDENAFPVTEIKLLTKLTPEEYLAAGEPFDSPLFRYTMQNFNVKRREFCYNGDWAYELNFGSGLLHRCYDSILVQNIFEKPDNPIRHAAIGNRCNSRYCFNSSHFMSLGTIPELDGPTYVELRDRPEAEWYRPRMRAFLNHKLSESHTPYSPVRRFGSNALGVCDNCAYDVYAAFKRHQTSKQKNAN